MGKFLIAFHKLSHDYSDIPAIVDQLPINDIKERINGGTYLVDSNETAQEIYDKLKVACHASALKEIEPKIEAHLASTQEPSDSLDESQHLKKRANIEAANRHQIYVVPADVLPK
jgi:hypothetical protein